HSGLPKTNGNNQILTKLGEPATDSTPDEDIDWIGNEGIKVSRIIERVRAAQLPAQMEAARNAILQKTEAVKEVLDDSQSPSVNISSSGSAEKPLPTTAAKPPDMTNKTPNTGVQVAPAPGPSSQSFLVVILNK